MQQIFCKIPSNVCSKSAEDQHISACFVSTAQFSSWVSCGGLEVEKRVWEKNSSGQHNGSLHAGWLSLLLYR